MAVVSLLISGIRHWNNDDISRGIFVVVRRWRWFVCKLLKEMVHIHSSSPTSVYATAVVLWAAGAHWSKTCTSYHCRPTVLFHPLFCHSPDPVSTVFICVGFNFGRDMGTRDREIHTMLFYFIWWRYTGMTHFRLNSASDTFDCRAKSGHLRKLSWNVHQYYQCIDADINVCCSFSFLVIIDLFSVYFCSFVHSMLALICIYICLCSILQHSILWYCWFGIEKGVLSVKMQSLTIFLKTLDDF